MYHTAAVLLIPPYCPHTDEQISGSTAHVRRNGDDYVESKQPEQQQSERIPESPEAAGSAEAEPQRSEQQQQSQR